MKYKLGKGGLKGYRIGDDGSVWSNKRGEWRKLKPQLIAEKGYGYVGYRLFHGEYGAKTYYAHLLVLTAFIGPRPEGMQGCHKNGDRGDNRLSNLKWGTHLENFLDKCRHGTTRLTPERVWKIREDVGGGMRVCDAARKHGVSPRTIREIRDGRTWGWLK